MNTPADRRNDVQKALAAKHAAVLQVKPEDVDAAFTPEQRSKLTQIERQVAAAKTARRGWDHWQVVYDVGPPTPTYVLRRGNHLTPADEVAAGFFSVLCAADALATAQPKGVAGASSGRRLALARWLTDRRSPAGALALRVRVNRIWQHLFGQGIVETPDNFGLTGAAPTHRELLEWLAGRFAADGQRLKPLVRLLVTSTVYRQSSTVSYSSANAPHGRREIDPFAVDPDNRLLWRMPLRRLESEAVRDAMLAASGRLDRTLGGQPVPVEARPDGTFVVPRAGPAFAGAAPCAARCTCSPDETITRRSWQSSISRTSPLPVRVVRRRPWCCSR